MSESNNNVTYDCQYHVVWCPKYRRGVLVSGADRRLKATEWIVRPWTTIELAIIAESRPAAAA